jgi:bisphosphoglycerate-dependent phosphoglycerate mutase
MGYETLEVHEFDCEDCGCHVYIWADDKATRCLVCTWIKSIPDLTEAEIAEIRMMTATPAKIKWRNNDG